MRKAAAICLLAILIPYIGTLAWTGRAEGNTERGSLSGKMILLDRNGSLSPVDMEEYLIGITALQIPAEYGEEAIKAQAIIARTYLCRQMKGRDKIEESALDLDYIEQSQMEEMWGSADYLTNYKKIRDAVQDTAGQVIKYNGDYIDPLFHRLSAGKTRSGDELHPYLSSVDAEADLEGENYLGIYIFTREEMASKLNSMSEPPEVRAEDVLESIQVIKKDGSGYVEAIQAGAKSYGGEEIQYALGLPSPAYTFEAAEEGIRCTTKGIGHGYGFDQFGASLKAAQGWNAEKILEFYYKNIVVDFE